jgi:hypothetical protein
MTMTAHRDATVAELRSAVAGPVIVPGDNNYKRCADMDGPGLDAQGRTV